RGTVTRKGVLQRTNVPASIVMLGMGKSSEDGKESQETSGANEVQRLRKTDFSKVAQIDSDYLEDLAKRLWKQMSLRLKRRMKSSEKQGMFDLRKTIRRSIGQGGDPIRPVFKQKKKRKQRLVILLDVSGSMDKYSFFLLRFLCALKEHFKSIEAFLFSTQLVRITNPLQAQNIATTLSLLSIKANNWSSGTTIGTCFREFNEQFAKQCMAGQTTVVILSDGLDTGEPEILALELNKIRLRCSKLIWLNPLKGMKGYAPTARGMEVALPHLDVFHSAHNLDSLLELEDFLQHV
ncbi:MAG: VWA domain-containing protein, partial [Bacteroidota bacterium]